jgi:hypothetical protein
MKRKEASEDINGNKKARGESRGDLPFEGSPKF